MPSSVEELSVDGGKIASALPGEPCTWQEYKVRLHDLEAIGAYFQDNDALIEWVNHQPLASPITCLGMGMTEFGTSSTKLPLTVNVGKFSIGIT